MWNFDFYFPTRIVFGKDSLSQLGSLASILAEGVVIVTGKSSMRSLGFLDEAIDSLQKEAVRVVAVVEGVPPNPTTHFISDSVELLSKQRDQFQAVVGLGGGSSIDAAKCIAFALENPGDVWDYINPEGKKPPENVPLPVIAVPSTAGTGSETSRNAVLTNPSVPAKCALSGPWLFPRIAVIDPRLSASQPHSLAAATAVDTFSHLFENYTQNVSDPITDLLNLDGMRMVAQFLPKALNDPGNLDLREPLALASAFGGIVLGVSGAHIGHALEHPISARYDVPHGEGLAALLPALAHCLEGVLPDRIRAVRDLFPGTASLSERLLLFFSDVGLHASLERLGLPPQDDPVIARDALNTMQGAVSRAPFSVDESSLLDILRLSRSLAPH